MNQCRLQNMKAVITGGNDGIGKAIASAFADEGADLWLIGRNSDKLNAAASSLRAKDVEVHVTALDLTDVSVISSLGSEIAETWDQLDILVNNAGMARFSEIADVTHDELMAQVNLSLLSPYLLTQQMVPLLKKAGGNVINISSTSAHRLIPGRPASVYAMTKGALNSLTKALALNSVRRGFV